MSCNKSILIVLHYIEEIQINQKRFKINHFMVDSKSKMSYYNHNNKTQLHQLPTKTTATNQKRKVS